MRQFIQQYNEWIALPRDRDGRSPISVPWAMALVNPSEVVFQWDGATKAGSHSAGVMVIRLRSGGLIRVMGIQLLDVDDRTTVELLVLREAVLWCLNLGFHTICFEGDVKVVIDKINQSDTRDSRVGGFAAGGGVLF
ncbi:unnamed protein product [Linum trigynum]|uniref:RNase H type-1 domain-containing protein n=1 Tax=Linum trigynum TaxID=586398 RepID=A0AAV2CVN9_9ROSI